MNVKQKVESEDGLSRQDSVNIHSYLLSIIQASFVTSGNPTQGLDIPGPLRHSGFSLDSYTQLATIQSIDLSRPAPHPLLVKAGPCLAGSSVVPQ